MCRGALITALPALARPWVYFFLQRKSLALLSFFTVVKERGH